MKKSAAIARTDAEPAVRIRSAPPGSLQNRRKLVPKKGWWHVQRVVEAIVAGRQPPDLTVIAPTRRIDLPLAVERAGTGARSPLIRDAPDCRLADFPGELNLARGPIRTSRAAPRSLPQRDQTPSDSRKHPSLGRDHSRREGPADRARRAAHGARVGLFQSDDGALLPSRVGFSPSRSSGRSFKS